MAGLWAKRRGKERVTTRSPASEKEVGAVTCKDQGGEKVSFVSSVNVYASEQGNGGKGEKGGTGKA